MAETLLGYMRRMQEVVLERYAPYHGRRIPCENGRASYHLAPFVAYRCCGHHGLYTVASSGLMICLPMVRIEDADG